MLDHHLHDHSPLLLAPPDRTPEGRRSTEMIPVRGYTGPNKHGVVNLEYEIGPGGSKTGWRLYKCRCEKTFYKRVTHSQATGCGRCGLVGASTRLDLLGKTYGAIEVIGHERGLGWKIKCWCGRERFILNGSQVRAGAFKTCGQCTIEERMANANHSTSTNLPSMAPPSNLRLAVVAANTTVAGSTVNLNLNQCLPPAGWLAAWCASDHELISFNLSGDCPLCLAMARIELLAENAG